MASLLQIIKRLQEMSPKEMTIQGLEQRVEVGPQNPGEQANTTINRVLIATYPSARVVTKASQDKSNLLITYRPLFPFAIDRLSGLDLVRVRLLSKNYISTYIIGSGWLCARDGLNDAFCDAIGVQRIGDFLSEGDYGQYVPFGRICKLSNTKNHSGFVNYLAAKLKLSTVLFSGDLDEEVGDFLLVAGSHIDMPDVINAKREDLRTIITGELSPEIRLLANEEGLNTIELGAFVTEDPGMKRLRDSISLEYPDLKIEFMASPPVSQGLRPYKEDMA